MTFTCQLTAKDYILASRLQLCRVRPFLKVLLWLIVVPCVGLGLFLEARQTLSGHPDWMALFLPLAIGYALIYWFVLFPRRIRKVFKQQKTLQVPFTAEITETGFRGSSELGNFQMPLKDFHKWIRGKDMILLFRKR